MSAYVELTDLKGEIPDEFLTQALDDDGDGVADSGVWDQIAAQASTDVDAFIGGRYTVPLSAPIPATVSRAARIFALEKLYLRRGVQPNPWKAQADELRALLGKIGTGEVPLSVAVNRAKPSGTVISETARTHSPNGNLTV